MGLAVGVLIGASKSAKALGVGMLLAEMLLGEQSELSVGVPVGVTLAILPGDSAGISLGEQLVQPPGQSPGELRGRHRG